MTHKNAPKFRYWILIAIATLATGTPTKPAKAQNPPPADLTQPHPAMLIRPGDRILFVGDQVTQQMFYTRAVATGLLALMPNADLRIFNGGRDGATANSTIQWIDDLLELTSPTVVSLAVGSNEALAADADAAAQKFKADLTQLLAKVQAHQSVRSVVILGTLPLQSVSGQSPDRTGQNQSLYRLTQAAKHVAQEHGATYIDLFEHMERVYHDARNSPGEPMTLGGRVPTEVAHTVIASVVLRGLGVSEQEFDPIGWSPLRPVEMRRIRQVLALQLHPPNLDAASRSRALYQSLQRFDELFFRQWRLSRKDRPGRSRQASQHAAVQEAWQGVSQLAITQYSKSANAQCPPLLTSPVRRGE